MQAAQVIYISLMDIKKMPSFEERERLHELQLEFQHFYWLLYRECKNQYEIAVRKQSMQNRLRSEFYIVENNCEN